MANFQSLISDFVRKPFQEGEIFEIMAKHFAPEQIPLAEALTQLVNHFRFDKLLALTQPEAGGL